MRVWPWRVGQEDGDRAMLPLGRGAGLGEVAVWLRDLSNSTGPWC